MAGVEAKVARETITVPGWILTVEGAYYKRSYLSDVLEVMHGPLGENENIASHELMRQEFVAVIYKPHVQCPSYYEDRFTASSGSNHLVREAGRSMIQELESMLDAVDPQSANKGATGSSRRKFDLNKDGFSLEPISKEKITLFGQEKLFGMSG